MNVVGTAIRNAKFQKRLGPLSETLSIHKEDICIKAMSVFSKLEPLMLEIRNSAPLVLYVVHKHIVSHIYDWSIA